MADHEFVIILKTVNDQSKKVHAEEAAAVRKRVKDANDAAKAVGDAAKKEAEDRKRVMKVVADAEKEQARARVAAAKEVEVAAKVAAKAQADAAKEATKAQDAAAAKVGDFAKSLLSLGAGAVGLSGLASIVGMVADSFERARKQAEDAGKFASGYRETLKEIAFLKGQSAPTSEIVRADIDFRKQTLQNAGDAKAVQESFLNKAGVSTDTALTQRKISVEEREKAMVFAGQLHARVGGDPGSFGDLYGMIPSMEVGKERLTADDINRRAIQMINIGQGGGAGAGQFASAISGASGLVTSGAYKDPARLAAIGSALSIATPSEIGQGLDQINRFTQGAFTNVTQGPGAKMSQSAWMKEIGAEPSMDTPEILALQFKDMEKHQKEQGKNFNAMIYLAERDFASVQDKGRFAQLYGARNDLFGKGGFLEQAGTMPTTEQAAAPWAVHAASVQGQKQKSDLLQDRTKQAMGGGAQEYYQRLETTAFNIMQEKGQVSGSLEEWKGSRTLRGGMANLLRGELAAKGENVRPTMGSDLGGGKGDPLLSLFKTGQAGSKEAADEFYRVGMKVKQLGGNPMGENTKMFKDYEKNLERIADTLDSTEKVITGVAANINPAPIQVAIPGGANAGPTR